MDIREPETKGRGGALQGGGDGGLEGHIDDAEGGVSIGSSWELQATASMRTYL